MPSSLLALAPNIVTLVQEAVAELGDRHPAKILDVGPGNGKMGVLLREYLDPARVDQLDAIEAEPRYVQQFRWLEHIYDTVFVGDVTWSTELDLAAYDVVLMCDVIEHLDEGQALELLDAIPGYVIVSTPRDFFQNPEADLGWETERHRSHWDSSKFGPRVDREDVNALEQYAAVLVRLGRR